MTYSVQKKLSENFTAEELEEVQKILNKNEMECHEIDLNVQKQEIDRLKDIIEKQNVLYLLPLLLTIIADVLHDEFESCSYSVDLGCVLRALHEPLTNCLLDNITFTKNSSLSKI